MTVGPEDDEVFDIGAVECDGAMNQVVELHRTWRDPEANRARLPSALPRGNLSHRQRAAGAIVLPALARAFGADSVGDRPAGFPEGFALCLELLRRAVAKVRVTLLDQALSQPAMAIEPLGLKVRRVGTADLRPLVPIEPEPAHPVQDALHHFRRRSVDVGVLDAEHEDAAVPAREEPVEERRPGAANVKIAGRGWGESNAGSHRNGESILPE